MHVRFTFGPLWHVRKSHELSSWKFFRWLFFRFSSKSENSIPSQIVWFVVCQLEDVSQNESG